jgi:hypothetical protein
MICKPFYIYIRRSIAGWLDDPVGVFEGLREVERMFVQDPLER